jgi:hypothetical protein
VVERSRRRGPFDPRWADAHRRRHLRLVPEPAEAGVPAAAFQDETNSDRGFASVTYLPTFIPTGPEHDDGSERDGQEGGEDLARQVAAVLLVPKL